MCILAAFAGHEALGLLQAQVYLGKWRGSEVAVKVLRGGVSPEAAADFRSEVDMLASLRHPNILLFLGAPLDMVPVRRPGFRVQVRILYSTFAAPPQRPPVPGRRAGCAAGAAAGM